MAIIKIKYPSNNAELQGAVDSTEAWTEIEVELLADTAFKTALGQDTTLRAALKAYFDTIYAPKV